MVGKYDVAKLIIRDGSLIGYWLYATGGVFNTLRFIGYHWLDKPVTLRGTDEKG